jgi:hypothetical protein
MEHPFYNLYSWWTIGLFLLYEANIIKFSILPTVLCTFIGAVIFLTIKKNLNPRLAATILFIHAIPFFVIPIHVTHKDILYNAMVFLLYMTSLSLQDTNVFKVYGKLLKWDTTDITVYKYYKALGLFR